MKKFINPISIFLCVISLIFVFIFSALDTVYNEIDIMNWSFSWQIQLLQNDIKIVVENIKAQEKYDISTDSYVMSWENTIADEELVTISTWRDLFQETIVKGNYMRVNFDKQPTEAMWDYSSNSKILRTWMWKNTQTFSLDTFEGYTDGFFYVALRKPLECVKECPTLQSVVIDTNIDGLYGRLSLKDAIWSDKNQYFLFDIKNVVINGKKSFDLIPYLNNLRIGWFVWDFEGNGIEEITIAYY